MRSTLTLILTILATFCQGECPIECYCDRVTTCTGDKILTRFPKISTSSGEPVSPYPAVSRVEFHDYGVRYLSKEDFLQMISNLTELSLTRNSLESIDNETFSLSSSTSLLTSRPSTSTTGEGEERPFFSAHLSSSKDEIAELVGLKLRILDLSQNKLNYFVGGGRLKRLKILDLSSNKLQQVYELSAIESLESVNLRDNRISYLQPTIFQNMKYLQYINLDSNTLGSVDPSTFSNLPALAHLILSSNPISNLLPGFFWNSRVQFVDVSHVGLSSIPPSLTKTVRDFRCANNNLTIIRQTDFESYPNVGLLVLDENAIETVEDDAFGRLDFLTRLWMNGNRLTRTPQNLPPSLQSLHLEDNRIVNLSSVDFKNLRNLQELNLHGNRISSLPPYVFAELISLKNLDLRSNEIDVIYRDSFANLSKLQTLDVSQNPIKVIVTGAFGNLEKLSLLHLSRLMEPIEFDTTSFSPLQKLQILELDDSPHFALKLIQDSALTHLPKLTELNLQRCELEDLNLVANALSELNLQVVKISGNPWDCQDLYGSGIHELMNRPTVVDHPVCEQPPGLKGVLVSSVNFSLQSTQPTIDLEENSSDENLLDFTELTPDHEDQSYISSNSDTTSSLYSHSSSSSSLDKVTNAPNTNSPENAPHASDANVNPLRSSGTAVGPPDIQNEPLQSGTKVRAKNLPTSPNTLPNSDLVLPSTSISKSTNGTASVVPISRSSNSEVLAPIPPRDSSGNAETIKIDRKNISATLNTSGGSVGDSISQSLDADLVPTRSYFDYSWKSSHPVETGTNSISLSSERSGGASSSSRSGNKKPAIPISIGGTRTTSLDKTKTNDDNTIIDEGGRSKSSGGGTIHSSERRRPDDEEETGPKSIDGFPSGYSDADRLPSQSTSIVDSGITRNQRKAKPKPEAFHLRRESQPNTQIDNTSGTIIIKTIIISATACLVSILLLLSISYGVYRVTQRKSGISFCSSVRRKSEEDENGPAVGGTNNGCTRMSYTRFGRRSERDQRNEREYRRSYNQNHQDFDSDSDQVELSGITNRLYLENEEIYHIT